MKPTDADRELAKKWTDADDQGRWMVIESEGNEDSFIDDLATLIAQVRAEERERCARVAELESERLLHASHRDGVGLGWTEGEALANDIAAAIRRGDEI